MFEVILILLPVALNLGLTGSLLVVRDQSMLADALSHSVLLGIVLGFFISGSLESPLLVIGATVLGVVTVLAIDFVHASKVTHDAATGLIFTFFFAIAVLLISLFARNVHLDTDMVLMGEVLFAPLNRVSFLGLDLPAALLNNSLVLLAILGFYGLFYRRLMLFLFDETQAQLSGIRVKLFQVVIMTLVSLVTVVSFDTVGSIAVLSLMTGPSMTSLLFSRRFGHFLLLTSVVAVVNVAIGVSLAFAFDLTIAGTCSVVVLLVYLLCYAFKKTSKTKNMVK